MGKTTSNSGRLTADGDDYGRQVHIHVESYTEYVIVQALITFTSAYEKFKSGINTLCLFPSSWKLIKMSETCDEKWSSARALLMI